ncbi:Iron-containing redox enzyme [Actinokineospora alba]|uniref:Iron-containing redox enzyme n=1 Tax=Actinokineospora alba TaxID=504798 RepID=A0A1H0TVN5_9PSEU|nr:iron-containing redox enzyme family protein [Actinokineospora alba]TDP70729.1 heme oxygenase-like protein [Actinokineospora alba]SDJ14717.1 Iron-containing redox enzyme [Actinokineospora alba]SDP57728.1 Iron-containing redox enzyme [Actinokineospora alba]
MTSPTLPAARGELSAAVRAAILGDDQPLPTSVTADPYGEDLTLALHLCYELHYRGFAEGLGDLEWSPELLRLRGAMERVFLDAVRADVAGGSDVSGELEKLLVETVPGSGVSHFLRDRGEAWHLREYFIHRSVYHLKEADPHAWVIPRLRGRAKAALVAVEFDEFGGGRAERMHSQLYADLLADAGLHNGYWHYLDLVPAPAIAVVNLMSLFGLHRARRGALVGHFAAAEITTAPSAGRLVKAVDRLGFGPACRFFFSEHVEADAVHEQVMREDVIGGLLDDEPELAAEVVLGIQGTELLEARLADHLLASWQADRTSLLVDQRISAAG